MTAPLILHTESSRAWGGQEIRVLTELTALRKAGFRTALIARKGAVVAERARQAGLEVRTVPNFSKLNPATWLRLVRIVRALRPAVLNAHSSEDAWTAAPLARLLGVPLVLRTRHVSAPVASPVSYRFPHAILACSEAILAQLARQGLDAARISVVPTGNDEARFRFSSAYRQAIRARYGVGDADTLLGNVGFLRDYKGHAFILDTLAALPPQYKAMLVGDGDMRHALEAQAARLGLGERLIFAGHQEEPTAFYSAFDLFFFSSNAAEGVSQALVQALLNGLPVLACELASTAEVLSGIAASRLVAYGDVPAACAALRELTALPRRDVALMAVQGALIGERYGLNAMIARILALYAHHGIVPPAPVMPKNTPQKGG